MYNVLVGWTEVCAAPTGELAKQQVVAKAKLSQALKPDTSLESECEVGREYRTFLSPVEGQHLRRSTGASSRRVPYGLRGRHVVKGVNESSEPLGGRLGTPAQLKAFRISRQSAKSECARVGRM
jgi:hypothetical protein